MATLERFYSLYSNIDAAVAEISLTGAITLPVLRNPAVSADIRQGLEAIDEHGEKITGSMTEKETQTYLPSLSEQIIAKGQFLNGDQTIHPVTGALLAQLDPDFVTGNIRKGVDLFGVMGAWEELPVIQSVEITENGTYSAPDGVDGYSPVIVNVEASGGANIQSGSFTPAENVESFTIAVNGTVKNFAFRKATKDMTYGVRTMYGAILIDELSFEVSFGSNSGGSSLNAFILPNAFGYIIDIQDGQVTVGMHASTAGAGWLVPERYDWVAW